MTLSGVDTSDIVIKSVPFKLSEIHKGLCQQDNGNLIFNRFRKDYFIWVWVALWISISAALVWAIAIGYPFGVVLTGPFVGGIGIGFIVRTIFPSQHAEIVVNPTTQDWTVNYFKGQKYQKSVTYNNSAIEKICIKTEWVETYEYAPTITTQDRESFRLTGSNLYTVEEANLVALAFATNVGYSCKKVDAS